MKFTILLSLLLTSISATAVPDTSNTTAVHLFEKRKFSCLLSCDMPKAWCVSGKSIKKTFTGGNNKNTIKECRCGRLRDQPRCAANCGWKC